VTGLVERTPASEVLAREISSQCHHVETFGVQPEAPQRLGQPVRLGLERVGVRRPAHVWRLASDVDRPVRHLPVEQVAGNGKELVTTTPKNHERRKVQLDAHTVAALKSWRKMQAEERLAWGTGYEDTEGIVFTRENGSQPTPNSVSKTFLRAQAGVDLPRITFHEMRHTHATIQLRGLCAGPHRIEAARPQRPERDVGRLRRCDPRRRHDCGRRVLQGGVGRVSSKSLAISGGGRSAAVLECAPDLANRLEVETGFEPVYTDLQSVASPLGHSTRKHCSPLGLGETRSERTTGFEPATLTLAR
jgi:hypothetical protein